jgi:hypothetical protein
MKFSDKSIRCSMCGANFTFTANEQDFFASRGQVNEPKRCHECRKIKKPERSRSIGSSDRYSGLSIGIGR